MRNKIKITLLLIVTFVASGCGHYPANISSALSIRTTLPWEYEVRVTGLPLADWDKLAKFKKLDYLCLSPSFAPQVTDDHIIALSKGDFPHLRCVSLWGATQVTDKGLKALTSFPSIRDLMLPGTSITDQGMKIIATGFPNLSDLVLEDCQLITPTGYLALAASPTIKWLTLTLNPLSQADIENIILNLPNITNWTISDPNNQLNHESLKNIATDRQIRISVMDKNRSSRNVFDSCWGGKAEQTGGVID